MSDSSYKICGNEIHFDNGRTAQFVYPIARIVERRDILLVHTAPPPEVGGNEKLSGIDLSGRILWQIEPQHPVTVADIAYQIKGNEIHFENGSTARFDYPVAQILQFGRHLVVLIWPPRGTVYNENVFGADLAGNILWQVEPQYPRTVKNGAYCGLHSENGYAVAGNIKDLSLYLDPISGKIVKRRFQTHW